MKITHYCNSFIGIECQTTRIMCDPWVGISEFNAWLSFPFRADGHKIVTGFAPQFIYISHIHNDHFDPKTLIPLDKSITILIKKFRDQRLYGKIKELGFEDIRELEGWQLYDLNDDVEAVIIPSGSLVKGNIEGDVDYDLDTSLMIRDKKSGLVFFNNVDTPLAVQDLKDVKAFARKNWDKAIDIACLPVGAASEYPHCFINLDRQKCKDDLVSACLDDLPERVESLGANILFIAGGTYVIRGKYSSLNQYIAQPSFEGILSALQQWTDGGNPVYQIEGGQGLEYDGGAEQWSRFDGPDYITLDKNEYAASASEMEYDYSSDFRDGNCNADEWLAALDVAYNGALQNYHNICGRIGAEGNWQTIINLYQDYQLDEAGDPLENQEVVKKFEISFANDKPLIQTLTLHLDADLFFDLLTRKASWNGAISGTYIIYERSPNIYVPDIPMSLNFLVTKG